MASPIELLSGASLIHFHKNANGRQNPDESSPRATRWYFENQGILLDIHFPWHLPVNKKQSSVGEHDATHQSTAERQVCQAGDCISPSSLTTQLNPTQSSFSLFPSNFFQGKIRLEHPPKPVAEINPQSNWTLVNQGNGEDGETENPLRKDLICV
ncbi:hypothetical protein H6P81_019638 [Aristolochia fimbriata]|uniref:Uncharacterized protein n=1 Tax=Aristolochia fimbriata TaxID=158543 RepID=A0AAV7DWW8_ARIFI|nr:hypothetical protein H6P81_019638 [Aristolochia fimbriata]